MAGCCAVVHIPLYLPPLPACPNKCACRQPAPKPHHDPRPFPFLQQLRPSEIHPSRHVTRPHFIISRPAPQRRNKTGTHLMIPYSPSWCLFEALAKEGLWHCTMHAGHNARVHNACTLAKRRGKAEKASKDVYMLVISRQLIEAWGPP